MAISSQHHVLVANKPGKVVSVPFSLEEPILFLIERITAKLNQINSDFQRPDLYLNGIPLDTLAFVKTLSGKTLTMSCDPSYSIKTLKQVIAKRDGLHKVEFSKVAPAGHVVSPGANIECKCECTVYRVVCSTRFGTTGLSKPQLRCPNCTQSNKTVLSLSAFTRASICFHGIGTTGEQHTAEWANTWNRLVIESVALGTKKNYAVCLLTLSEDEKTLPYGHQFHGQCQSLQLDLSQLQLHSAPDDGTQCPYWKLELLSSSFI
ncbi:MAG: hypothetical protein J3R72DRAFT_494313 [Linnemannia gamsii]|nr:MAG: hypothetical protein J3R72DRAFT_494313 [Linnemannia gamsii]